MTRGKPSLSYGRPGAEALKLGVVVEGVETAEQLAFLSTGPELFIQGWYFSKALPGDQLQRFVRERASTQV